MALFERLHLGESVI